ncbi:hypothetical protein ET495_12285 [Xylanimonas allomyrinae]|uniref:Cell envelope-related transcriptional attenuator domain-containing protein n=1 Tax=Xylanimonas allomyrinae TaxID=2509459 RepID=A0A4P6EMJ8_9MICO|nr:LCP family protein [Xylanimonas allomyrinae]QAY63882.1 hypothetical protein ET495_12285 [Xylanimonas allomyrinae]
MTLFEAPGAFTTALCGDLGIRTDHLVIVRMESFVAMVEAVGGVEVTVPYPYRDHGTGIDIPAAGTVRLGGDDALALVRSRHGEQRIDGAWVADSDDAGAAHRADMAGSVMSALAVRARSAVATPWGVQRLAWAATGGLAVDSGTSLPELAGLTRLSGAHVADVPVRRSATADIIAYPDDATMSVLAGAGYHPGDCHVPGAGESSTAS